jgi:hypothetical protein
MKKAKASRRKYNNFNARTFIYQEAINIDKSLFEFDLFWSIQNGTLVNIDTLINIYSQYVNTQNMKALVSLFGKKRVLSVIRANDYDHQRAHKKNISIINDNATKKITANDFAPFII